MRLNIGELLLKENRVSPQQLQNALNHQKLTGGNLSRAFVGLGFVTDEEITSLLSRLYLVPSINLDRLEVDPAIIKIIPPETARRYQVLPLSRSRRTLTIAMADPSNVLAIDDIRFMTGYNVEPVVASESALEDAVDRYYARSPGRRRDAARAGSGPDGSTLSSDDMAAIGSLSDIDLAWLAGDDADTGAVKPEGDEIDLGNLARSLDASPIVTLTNVILVDSLKRGASDIHIEPYEKKFRVRFRVDGILYNVIALPMKLREPLTRRIKVMARLNVAERRLPQDGRIRIRMKVENRSRVIDFRVSVLPTLWGETIVMRLRDKSKVMVDMNELGFEQHSLERFRSAVSRRCGIVLVTGPQKSGKTNTLYSAIAALDTSNANIMTAEEPVELDLPGTNQVEVNEHFGESVATVLRSFRHADPDIVLVSEIRDSETAKVAFGLAEQGHLVLSTLHTSDAPSTVARLLALGIDAYLVAAAVNLIQAQRLVRRICSRCKVDVTAEVPSQTLVDIGFTPDQVGSFQVMRGKGCQTCNGTGYQGRVGLYEVMEMTDGIRDLIMVGASAVEIKRKALEEGMLTLRMSGLEKIKGGVTTVEEVLRETVL